MSSKHTPGHSPGPFTFKRNGGHRAAIADRNGYSIATLLNLSPGDYIDANGHLFAAAPELLNACKLALTSCDPHAHISKIIRAAITKAEGTNNGP